jgi:hypothetical protein
LRSPRSQWRSVATEKPKRAANWDSGAIEIPLGL